MALIISRAKAARYAAACLLSSAAFLACSTRPTTASAPLAVGKVDGRWTDPNAIPVCWMQNDAYDDLKTLVETRVKAEYARANLHFTGWQVCTAADLTRPMVRVEFRAAVPLGAGFTVGCSLIGMTAQAMRGVQRDHAWQHAVDR